MPLIKIEKIKPWRDSDTEKSLRGVACIYQVFHLPTKATYIGTTSDAAHAFAMWVHRLRHTNTKPPLSLAVRAVYTKREDFYFGVLELHAAHVPVGITLMKWLGQVKAHGPEFCLNMLGSKAEIEFWINRTPIDRRALLMEPSLPSPPAKVKLVPGKYQHKASVHDPRYAKMKREQAEAEQQGTLFRLGDLIKK